jgi:glycosyltransferase involved in cell wall biosynthesis
MRVCLIAHRFYEGNSHMMQFANALARRGDEVDVISLRAKGMRKREIVDGVNVYRIQARTIDEKRPISYLLKILRFELLAALLLAWLHLRKPYHLIHIQSVPDFLVYVAAVPKMLGTPVILDLRDLVPELYASKFQVMPESLLIKILMFVERISVRFADHVVIANPIWHQRIVKRSARADRCTMIWYYPDPEVFHPRARHTVNGRFLIMYPGTLNWHQGVDIAVKAFPRVLQQVPEAEFHIYGHGPEKAAIVDLVRQLKLTDKVKLFDSVPVKDIATVMANSDVGVVPKRASCLFGNEAASTKIPEFMALGVPVVASRTKVESCFYDESLVRYFRSEDEDDLVNALVQVHNDPKLSKQLVENGVEYIEQNKWDVRMGEYLRVVDGLVSPQPRNGMQALATKRNK